MSLNTDQLADKCPDELNEAGHAPVCGSCIGQKLCQEMFNKVDTDIEDINTRMSVIKHKIIVLSGKGGVGKSTFSANLAMGLASQKYKVGIVDFDICGPSIANLMNVEAKTIVSTPWGWKPLVSPHYDIKVISVATLLASKENAVIYKGPRKTNLIKRILKETFWGKLDYLICDTPPGTSDEHLTIVKLLKHIQPDGGVIVSTPQKLAVDAVRKEISFCKKLKLNVIGIIENMSSFMCPCCQEPYNIFPNSNIEKMSKEKGLKYLGAIPIDAKIAECSENGENYFQSQNANTQIVEKYQTIISNIQQCIQK